jgi:hypothetical protein
MAVSRSGGAAARRAALEASGHLERSETWNGLSSGDKVVVSGIPARGAEWRFRAHVLNRNNGTESVEVVGGRPGENKIRSFGPERIFAVRRKRGSRTGRRGPGTGELSLAEAPQLPLG